MAPLSADLGALCRKPISSGHSYAFCERLTRREAGNFYHAFSVLPRGQRRSMCALYAFMRITDDLSDSDEPVEKKRIALEEWRLQLRQALDGQFTHPVHTALKQTIDSYRIPSAYLEAVVDGVEMDLQTVRYETFEDLYRYCYHVASAVGLACIHIWGFSNDRAKKHAEDLGIAFQLTNILRDLREDAGRGRFYLPAEDIQRFNYTAESLRLGTCNLQFKKLMRFEVERARSYYRASRPLTAMISPPGRAVLTIMARTYEALLDVIESRDYDVFSRRVSLSKWKKMSFAVQALPVRWGWV